MAVKNLDKLVLYDYKGLVKLADQPIVYDYRRLFTVITPIVYDYLKFTPVSVFFPPLSCASCASW